MFSRPLTCLSAILLVFCSSGAFAQACCSGGQAVAPIRLGDLERAAAGLVLRQVGGLGSVDATGKWQAAGAGNREIDLEQDLLAAVRVSRRVQVALTVPWLETARVVPGVPWATGQGLGDVDLAARADVLRLDDARPWPALAVVAGVTMPTGRAADQAKAPLATDVTGTGTWQLRAAVVLERQWQPWLVQLAGVATWAAPRQVGDLRAQQGMSGTATAAVVRELPADLYGSLAVTWLGAGASTLNGQVLAESQRSQWSAGTTLLWQATAVLRLHAGLTAQLPLPGLSQNATVTFGGVLGAVYVWP